MVIKMTFSLDEPTARRLNEASVSLGKPKSEIVREAIRDYAERMGRLSEVERIRMLGVFDEVVAAIPERPADDVDAGLAEIGRARREASRDRS
jgi:metal-responsive CopG/Arc/MetJ family transcriptional regulator